jgi:hypothetical protein
MSFNRAVRGPATEPRGRSSVPPPIIDVRAKEAVPPGVSKASLYKKALENKIEKLREDILSLEGKLVTATYGNKIYQPSPSFYISQQEAARDKWKYKLMQDYLKGEDCELSKVEKVVNLRKRLERIELCLPEDIQALEIQRGILSRCLYSR